MLVSQTPHFRLTRFVLAGANAGGTEVVVDGISGMPDGLDRDRDGRIWVGLLEARSGLLTWLHANAWIKPFFLRLPLEWLPSPGAPASWRSARTAARPSMLRATTARC